MKTLDVQALRDGIDDTLEQLKKQSDEIAKVKKSVDGITSLDDALKGKGGDAIRAFYEECHTPFLRFYESFIEEYQSVLKKMKNALNSLEPNHNGYISQAFLEHDLEQGLNAADRITKHLVSKANATIAKVGHIVDLPDLNDNDFHEQNQKALKEINQTIEKLHAFDREQTNALKTAESDLETMQRYITRLEKMYTGPKIEIAGYQKGSILKPDEMDALRGNQETAMGVMLDKLDKRSKLEKEVSEVSEHDVKMYKLKKKLDKTIDNGEYIKIADEIGYDNLTTEQKVIYNLSKFNKMGTDIQDGIVGGAMDLGKDFIEGGLQLGWNVGWTIDHLHKDPKVVLDTVLRYDYKGAFQSMVDTLVEQWDEKVVNGDAYSRAHYFTYLIGSLWGLKDGPSSASTGSKDLVKAGKTAVSKVKKADKSVKQFVKPPINRYTPALEGILQDAPNSINVKNTPPILKELAEDKKKSVLVQAAPYTFKDPSGVTKTINLKMGHLKNKKHPVTGVQYDKDGFPIFKHVGEVKIDKKFYNASDPVQFRQATLLLKEKIMKNPELKKNFSDRQLQQISKGKRPEGYTWHHHQKEGVMQLVDSDIHGKTGHTGGRNIWGGGSQNR
ncbi:T7SS effector LXG polymorphic toxin [Bacillus swezeyi]|uniref:Integrase n=1 Tax=Bacillus swezeyi TaxID=1925020 RepID=A0A1R1RZI0_9BACI|nr:T7SS effector LXG polymorphic toxin [Bacillus swezeyi]MEC1260962.1 T7SS effector LXG polymorphic toxin [Bacillus swezeyi]MED2928899.1 T7SS effector LXG polymorphic toxin [Bacillus swezeyi]MED2964421.1 T7SS effector LXG polymorphic toxin [Bacillus swezeyi]MED3072421.1 T7SS effector LXG polymorphic toxin [Bacillus swezeyi]MED3081418.1 T7SS effector LXG polymorphic toxin [Bacillus swezeyi]